jgi:hypothetical protein
VKRRILKAGALGGCLLIGVLALVQHFPVGQFESSSSQPSQPAPGIAPRDLIVASTSGQRLASFFAGLKPNPEFTEAKLLAYKRQRSVAGCSSESRRGYFSSLFAFLNGGTVHAEPYCYSLDCSGSGWANTYPLCSEPYCSGTYPSVTTGGQPNMGQRQTGGQSCSPNPAYPGVNCPCDTVACSTCETCQDDCGCPAGRALRRRLLPTL